MFSYVGTESQAVAVAMLQVVWQHIKTSLKLVGINLLILTVDDKCHFFVQLHVSAGPSLIISPLNLTKQIH